MTFKEFARDLSGATTEEMVKATYASYFNIKYDTAHYHDLYTPFIFFEFKHDKNFQNIRIVATTLAQALYYVRRLKYVDTEKLIPHYICLADNDEALITETNKWYTYYSSDAYDWECPPSKPDFKLVDHLIREPETANIHVFNVLNKEEHDAFKKKIKDVFKPQLVLDFGDRKIITEENFESVFNHWKDIIGKYIKNGYKISYYFLSNIQKDKIIIDKERNLVVFLFEDKNSKTQKVLMNDYNYFWNVYNYVTDQETINGIHIKIDRLTEEGQRRYEGEFYTPLTFAIKAIHYLTDVLGKNWYKSGKYRIWDMAAGSGNLEWHLSGESYKYVYMSTLHHDEVEYLKTTFRDANCFQYDYLNDDIEYLFAKGNLLPVEPNWKLPLKLREELKNPELTWIVFINPPFATAQDAKQKKSKTGVNKTKIEVLMNKEKIGHYKRELFAQFIYRIVHELPKKTYLGMFSTLKYLNAPDSIDYRDKHFNYKYEKGFLFHSRCFQGVAGDFPIGFLIWNLAEQRQEDVVKIDISNENAQTVGVKYLRMIKKQTVLNNWFIRPKNSQEYILPALSNGVTVKEGNIDTRHRARPDFLASICSKGNDFQNSKYIVILSSPSASAGAFTVIPENFESALTLHAVRKIPKPTWLNDRNQFLIPLVNPNDEFTTDCIIWSLFSASNQTTALKDVNYMDNIFQIKNNFYPFTLEEIKNWEISDLNMKSQLGRDNDRFVAKWIVGKNLSDESKKVLNKAREIYKEFYSNLNQVSLDKWKINTWDAGWFQIRRCLTEHRIGSEKLDELSDVHRILAQKISPQIEEYGFLDKDEIYENIFL